MKPNGYIVAAAMLAALTLTLSWPASASHVTPVSEALLGEHDFTGTWRIVAAKSDEPKIEYVEAVRTELEGGGAAGVWFLPHVFRIGTSDNGLALSDSTGTILQVIMFMPVAEGDGDRMPPRFAGTWEDDRLTVFRAGRTGTKLRQSFKLENKDTRLVVKTRMRREGAGDFEVKRVYERVTAS